ncbi:MAG: tRNA pseudouridine(38-40) synthase TruA [Varibaculum sp.]|nr:tRNA pseudouridine(38-40) synthase TruA [Varibaculum sp.]
MRLRIDLAYDGTGLHGWAEQPGMMTVCGLLRTGIETIVRQPVEITVAGRTDAGVHAAAQVSLIQTDGNPDTVRLERGLSNLAGLTGQQLAEQIVVRSLRTAEPDFDPRFSALSRSYCYRLSDTVATYQPWQRNLASLPRNRQKLNLEAMQDAAQLLLGEHDFLGLAKPREGATTIRTLQRLEIRRNDTEYLEFWLTADAFAHSMVRFIVGALTEIGRGRRDAAWLQQVLDSGERNGQVPLAPARGLTLESIEYPEPEHYAAQNATTRQLRK